jgi:hypothetical protein
MANRNYKVEVAPHKKGKACIGATDCMPGDGACPPTTSTLTSTTETGGGDVAAVPTATSSRASATVDDAGESNSVIVVTIVLVLTLIGAMLGYIVYLRKDANNGALNEGGVPQRYENPAYDDGLSSSDGKDNLEIVIADFAVGEEKKKSTANKTVVAATKPAANAESAFDNDDGVDIDSLFGKMVTAGDADGDGMVSLGGAIALGMDTATFSDIDADGNGQLTKAEVTLWSEKNEAAAENMVNEDGDIDI